MDPANLETPTGARDTNRPRREWVVPASLLLLAAVPALGGLYRVLHLASGAEVTPANQRFFDAPAPVVLHGVACALFAFLGAFQFTSGSRRMPRRHRVRGMIFVPSALVVAATGLWMEARYELPASDGDLLSVFRAVFGMAMIGTTLLGVRSLLRRDFARHGAWMMRTYAIGMGAGTQVVVFIAWLLLVGPADVFQRALLMGASWSINLLFVEWVLHRRARRRQGREPGQVGGIESGRVRGHARTGSRMGAGREREIAFAARDDAPGVQAHAPRQAAPERGATSGSVLQTVEGEPHGRLSR